MSDKQEDAQKTAQLERVVESLKRVPLETQNMIVGIAKSLTNLEIIHEFNQIARDLFNLVLQITKKFGKEKEYNVTGYKLLFENALDINAMLPLDKFTLLILEFAAEIYAEEEDCFINMSIPDVKANVGNEFSIIRSEMFKKLWLIVGKDDKNVLKENIIMLTTYAHAHLYKTLMSISAH